jgi:hypothetical protein
MIFHLFFKLRSGNLTEKAGVETMIQLIRACSQESPEVLGVRSGRAIDKSGRPFFDARNSGSLDKKRIF